MLKLRYFGDPILETPTKKIESFDDGLKNTFSEMKKIMKDNQGIGLAANQVGLDKSFFLMADTVVINPEILETKGHTKFQEGCLSFGPEIFVLVSRAKKIRVKYVNQDFKEVEEWLDDIYSIVFQHECLPYDSIIITEDGKKTIKDIVDNDYKGKVLSFNEKTQKREFKKILNRSSLFNKQKKKWVKVKFSKTGPHRQLTCTQDHRCAYVDNPLNLDIKYTEAMNLKDKYIIRNIDLKRIKNREAGLYNKDQISIIIGSLMGDACISKDGDLTISHGEPFYKYALYKKSILNGKIYRGYSGFRDEYSNYILRVGSGEQMKYLRENVYKKEKSLTELSKLANYLSLAFWYMDDGCLVKKRSAQFHTEGFALDDLEESIKILKEKFDLNFRISPRKIRGQKRYILRLNYDDSDKFFSNISKWIPISMRYKIPELYRQFEEEIVNKSRLDFSLKKVTTVNILKSKESRLFDLEIDGNSNFFADNTLVHNCAHLNGKTFLDYVNDSKKRKVLRSFKKYIEKKNNKSS